MGAFFVGVVLCRAATTNTNPNRKQASKQASERASGGFPARGNLLARASGLYLFNY